MHEHQFDLVAALADGSATADETTVAEAALSACPECRAHYDAQAQVLAWMNEAPPVLMTDMERASLHRRLAAEARPRVGWFTRYVPRVAAVAAGFAVVGLATVSMLGGGADTSDPVSDTPTEEAAVEMDTSARQPSLADDDLMQSVEELPLGGADAAEDEATGDMAAEAPAEDGSFGMSFFDQKRLADLLEGDLPGEMTEATDEVLDRFRAACPDTLEESVVPEGALEAVVDEVEAYIVITTTAGDRTVTAYSAVDCTILREAPADNG